LNDLQSQGVPFGDKRVKTIEKEILSLIRQAGISKSNKFQAIPGGGQQIPTGGASQDLNQIFEKLMQKWGG
jgi:hypothetical protein